MGAKNGRPGAQRTKVGDYKLHGNESNVRLTIAAELQTEIEVGLGDEVSIYVVETRDGDERLEIERVDDD